LDRVLDRMYEKGGRAHIWGKRPTRLHKSMETSAACAEGSDGMKTINRSVVKDIVFMSANCDPGDLGLIPLFAKILAQPMELLAWELRRPNAVTWVP
jgi:hypothetical protein